MIIYVTHVKNKTKYSIHFSFVKKSGKNVARTGFEVHDLNQ